MTNVVDFKKAQGRRLFAQALELADQITDSILAFADAHGFVVEPGKDSDGATIYSISYGGEVLVGHDAGLCDFDVHDLIAELQQVPHDQWRRYATEFAANVAESYADIPDDWVPDPDAA